VCTWNSDFFTIFAENSCLVFDVKGMNIQCFPFGFPLLSIMFHYLSKLFPISIKCRSDVNMK
jgi:hypothetical protein